MARIGAAGLALAVALAACGEEPAVPVGETTAAPAVSEESTGETGPAARASAPPESNLSARTSSLTGNSSDLKSRIVGAERIVELPADVLFAFDSAELSGQAEPALRQVAETIRSSPPGAIRVIGHTDDKGTDDYNDALSLRRAQAVRDWLGEQVGVRQRDIAVEGAGESQPIVPNANPDGSDSEEGRSRNRRVEVVMPVGGG